MTAAPFDVAIIGAGCAGRSLAWHLLDHGMQGARITLIDPCTEFGDDRTWCFFDVVPHPFASLVQQRWSRWRVRAPGGAWVERGADGLSYCYLRSADFYNATAKRLREAGVSLKLGVRAGAVRAGPDFATIETEGQPVCARAVFDSRPGTFDGQAAVSFLQHFRGWFVRCEEPIFDPEVATLMDFEAGDPIAFLYELPFTRHHALIEATSFEPWRRGPARANLEGMLERRLHRTRFEIERTERGALPMSTAAMSRRSSERVYHIGLAAGMAKPSTGYAFLAIQRYSAHLARRLLQNGPLPPPPMVRPAASVAQDTIFLTYLRRHPEGAPHALVGLFRTVAPETLARFLNDSASAAENLSVMACMPTRSMISSMLASLL